MLADEGLAAALDSLSEHSPVPVHPSGAPLARLPESAEAAAYYVVSEAVANAAKHAHASLVDIDLRLEDGVVCVEVADDGDGGAVIRRGAGLEGLLDRVRSVGGEMTIDSDPGHGTRLWPRSRARDPHRRCRPGTPGPRPPAHRRRDRGQAWPTTPSRSPQPSSASRLDAVVLDIRMPPTHTTEGLDAALELRDRFPALGVLLLSQHLESRHAIKLLEGRPRGIGYLLKERIADPAEFAVAVRRVAAGGTAIDLEVVRLVLQRSRPADPLADLTAREREILQLIAEGWSNPRHRQTVMAHHRDRRVARAQHLPQTRPPARTQPRSPRPRRARPPAHSRAVTTGPVHDPPLGPRHSPLMGAGRLSRNRPRRVRQAIGQQVMSSENVRFSWLLSEVFQMTRGRCSDRA